jgi:type IV pilus assembly protein PilC
MIVVIPQFQNIFLGLLGPGELLPLPTRIVIAFSNFLAGWGGLGILVSIIGATVGIRFYYKTPGGRKFIDSLLLKVPVIGDIFRKISVARFSRTLSTLLSSGVPILQSLDITARTAGNVIIESAILKVREGVERGESFVEPLKATQVFPPWWPR